MNKYLLVGILVLIVALIGSIVYIESMSKPSITPFTELTPQVFSQELSSGKYTLIDVRTLDEYLAGHLKNAKQEDFYQTQAFSNYLDSLDKKGKYLIYCRAGNRSGQTLGLMQSKGFTTAYDLAGGYNAWLSSNLPTEK